MAETRNLHEQLDSGIGGFATLDDYHRYLAGTYAFRAALEPALPPTQGWEPQQLAGALLADLNDLGQAGPPVPAAPRLDNASAVAGALYVIEGSTLGARLLQRRAESLGLGPDHGARHLHDQTAEQGRWGRFLAWLEAGQIAPEQAAASANAVFQLALTSYGLGARA